MLTPWVNNNYLALSVSCSMRKLTRRSRVRVSWLLPTSMSGCARRSEDRMVRRESGSRYYLRYEAKLVQYVVKEVLIELSNTQVGNHLVVIEMRVQSILRLLQQDSKGIAVKFVLIYGVVGIGKTTIARAVWDQIGKTTMFECHSFLEDIQQSLQKSRDIVRLQEQLLSDILGGKIHDEFSDECDGVRMIKDILHQKKVLLVLDNVDCMSELNGLAIAECVFGMGSMIIVTSRNHEDFVSWFQQNRLLRRGFIAFSCKLNELGFNESLQLFCINAFGSKYPPRDLMKLAKKMVLATGGLPLALEELGSSLSKKTPTQWMSTLENLKESPSKELMRRFKIIFNGLNYEQKEIFLDIACFIIGYPLEYAFWIFTHYYNNEIKILIQKSLVKIGKNKELTMDNLVQNMGREIVYKESPNDPGNRSRLWKYEEVMDVLAEHKRAANVRGLSVRFEEATSLPNIHNTEALSVSTKALKRMSQLELLRIDNAKLVGCISDLPPNLRWFCWQGCPLEYVPLSYFPDHITVLDLSNSHVKEFDNWQPTQSLLNLRVLDLGGCHHLIRTPDFSGLQGLRRLILQNCAELVEVHESIGNLDCLQFLNLGYCKNLPRLPTSICELRSLEILILSNCSKLRELPLKMGSVKYLRELLVDGTAIEQLPFLVESFKSLEVLMATMSKLTRLPHSIFYLESLVTLILDGTDIDALPFSVGSLSKLKSLSLHQCTLLKSIPTSVGKMESLVELNLEGTAIREIPDFPVHISKIEKLKIGACRLLKKLPDSIGNLKNLRVLHIDGSAVTNLPDGVGSLEHLEDLDISSCEMLVKLPASMERMRYLKCFNMSGTGIVKLTQDFGMLSCLVWLNLGNNNFSDLPDDFSGLSSLKELYLQNCIILQSLPKLPSSLIVLDAANCISLVRVPDISHLEYLEKLCLNNCWKLSEMEGLIGLPSLRLLFMHGCSTSLGDSFGNKLVQDMYEHIEHLTLPGGAIPDRFKDMRKHILKRRVGYFEMEGACLPSPGFEITGLILWVVFEYRPFGRNDIVWLEKIGICMETGEDKVPQKRLEIKVKIQEPEVSRKAFDIEVTPGALRSVFAFCHIRDDEILSMLENGSGININVGDYAISSMMCWSRWVPSERTSRRNLNFHKQDLNWTT
ncbi:disease resistance protein RUN1-like isoform X2 [Macadamia integrifolia]|uniref:disease resistance protein RUN1-like isoform X2 n=1 Tax=Macadamia integrifolia TaxID=60698 RepID=UPI001C4E61EC|nr:disease resistance protein RUN1-like isoform X2 [Macadamia integrifolia]